jgi:hypothetical protein
MKGFKQNRPAQSISKADMNQKYAGVNAALVSHGRNMAVIAGAASFCADRLR